MLHATCKVHVSVGAFVEQGWVGSAVGCPKGAVASGRAWDFISKGGMLFSILDTAVIHDASLCLRSGVLRRKLCRRAPVFQPWPFGSLGTTGKLAGQTF